MNLKIKTNKIMKNILQSFLIAVLVIIGGFGLFRGWDTRQVVGSTIQGNDYYSTTTNSVVFNGPVLLKPGAGSLARVTITKAGTGAFAFYNATTSNVNLRTGNLATTAIQLPVFPAATVAGTYDFDIEFSSGLLMDSSGMMGTSTIVWR